MGTRGEILPGRWINLDVALEDKPDLVADGRALPFQEAVLEEVMLSHVLEHVDKWDGLQMLTEIRRILPAGGQVTVRVPDMRAVMTCYVNKVQPPYDHGLLIARDPDGNPVPWNVTDLDWVNHLFTFSTCQRSRHLWSYDTHTLWRALVQAGFNWIRPEPRRDWWEVCAVATHSDTRPDGEGWEPVKLRSTVTLEKP